MKKEQQEVFKIKYYQTKIGEISTKEKLAARPSAIRRTLDQKQLRTETDKIYVAVKVSVFQV